MASPSFTLARAKPIVRTDWCAPSPRPWVNRAKTYLIDAAAIACFTQATQLAIRPLPDAQPQLMADLVARRRQIVAMIGAERQRERRAQARVQKSTRRLIKALRKEFVSVDGNIDGAVRGSPSWREKENLLVLKPGVSLTIARALLAEIPELGTLDRHQIAPLAGLAPWTRQSDQWRGKSSIDGGRGSVRAVITQACDGGV